MKIYTLGDSHASKSYTFAGIDYVHCNWIGPVTMESVGKSRGNHSSSELLDEILQSYNIDVNDVVILCFGEIDSRCIINPRIVNGENEDDVINSLVLNFINTIINSNHKIFWILSITPPVYKNVDSENTGFPFRGKDEERSRYTKKMNTKLRMECERLHIPFVDVYDYYTDELGMLREEIIKDYVHIGDSGYVKNVLDKMING